MFRSSQIISASELLKNYKVVASHLRRQPEAVLITQKSAQPLVLLTAEMFEEILSKVGRAPEESAVPVGLRQFLNNQNY